ncbi:MFS transporter [Deinococcus lacus]|uniref:MFS transporter n=1 Tax=Deinococcus lacus TaxID=392561 RepID=A0ABW1YB53_9DEIO
MVLAALAPNMLLLVAARFVEGLGVGGLVALPFVVIPAAYTGQAQARMLAAVSSMWLLPGLLGPPLASSLAEASSWRTVFWALAGLLVVAAPLCLLPLRGLPHTPVKSSKRLLWPAAGLMLAAAALIEGLRRADLPGFGLAGLGLVGMALTMRPLFPAGLWSLRPGLPSAMLLRGFIAFSQMGLNSFVILALRRLHDLSLRDAGWMLSIGGLAWTLGSWGQAQLEKNTAPSRGLPASGAARCCSRWGWWSRRWACWGRCRCGPPTPAGWRRASAWAWPTIPTASGPWATSQTQNAGSFRASGPT